MSSDKIVIRGAQEHNLKNIDLDIPRDKLIVFTGVSGSGKSSLAFDTIYAEGQRRYVECLSAYARQFLGQLEKPKVDLISGLSPAIAIEQKAAMKNPRSTVGTVTEIYDYLRVLYARIGTPHCPKCGRAVGAQTLDQIVDRILLLEPRTRFLVLAPIVRGRKGEYREILEEARREGFLRVRINGEVRSLEEDIHLDKRMKHDLEIVVDRLILGDDIRSRLADSVSTALHLGDGVVVISLVDRNETLFYSERHACAACGLSLEDLTPQHFSFNSPHGMCPVCDGLGQKLRFDADLIIPEKTLSISNGAIAPLRRILDGRGISKQGKAIHKALEIIGEDFGFHLNVPWEQLSSQQQNVVLYGPGRDSYSQARWSKRVSFQGIIPQLERWLEGPELSGARSHFSEGYMSMAVCPACSGGRLRAESAAVTLNDRSIVDVVRMSIRECLGFFDHLTLTQTEKTIAEEVLREIHGRLHFLHDVGLHYLTLDRSAPSLSGGEAQRIRLASQIGSGLVGVLYILDEPSIGLHQRDNRQLLQTLLNLRDLGNTVVVVEHDAEIIRSADWVVDFGPGAGELGGEIVASGTLDTILETKSSLTGKFLSGKRSLPVPEKRRVPSSKWLTVRGARENNLKNVDVSFPLGLITCVTGVSGSGKSTLVNEILFNWLARALNRAQTSPGVCDAVEGSEWLDKVINIDQSPIGRTPRSNPATYVKLFDPIRALFSQLPEAKIRGFGPGHFSFNVPGGRCEACEGDGQKRIEMHFLADVFVTCDVCRGKRFNRETLQVKFKNHTISDILDLSVEQARTVFAHQMRVQRILKTLVDVGLGYIRLGQSAPTLSGGEAQRIKLAKELCRVSSGRTLYILDEPTTGLHFADVEKLLKVLNRLAEKGNTIIIIEHNLDVVKSADWVVDLGPEGGDAGGMIVAQGTPEKVVATADSHTGQFLSRVLNGSGRSRR